MPQNPFTELVALLRQVGFEPDAEEIADALWFAQFQPPSPARSLPPDDAASDSERRRLSPLDHPGTGLSPGESHEGGADPGVVSPPTTSLDSRLFPGAEDADPDGRRASSVLVPDASALPGSLDIGRALRPFGRRHPAPHRWILDEEGTAEATAVFGFVRPVLLPFPERWFNVALVVDASRSMDVWQKTIEEFEQLLARQGAFAQVSRWRLSVFDGIAIESGGGQRRQPSALHDPRGRTLILIATNGVAAFWDGDAVARVLADWSARAPVAILQLFSKSRWSHTVIGPPTREVRATVPGAPGRNLAMVRKAWERVPNDSELLGVPVLSLAAASVARWADAVMASGHQPTPAVVFTPGLATLDEDMGDPPEELLDPRARVERFNSIATREAFRLACHLAAVPLTLPIMRIVHQQICRQPRIEDLGEVLASGLLERLTRSDKPVDPDAVLYDFGGGVRDVLLGALPMESVFDIRARVQSALKDFIERQLGRAIGNFRAFVLDEHGEYKLPPAVEAFVEIERNLLKRLRLQGRPVEVIGPPGREDWAVLVGVSRYRSLPSLATPESDAGLFADWLRLPTGNQVPLVQIQLLLSPGMASEVDAALQQMLQTVQRQAAGTPVRRRLYLAFLGHGVALSDGSVALLTADASPTLLGGHVAGRAYADYFAHSGYFEEVVLIMDCGREQMPTLLPSPPPLTPPLAPNHPSVKRLALYGPGLGHSGARLIPALVEGLSGGGADANGDVTVSSLQKHLASQVPPGDPGFAFEAEFTEGDWVLARVEPREGEAILHLSPILAGTDVVLDGRPLYDPATDRSTLRPAPGVHVIELPAAGIRATFTMPQGGGVRVPLTWVLRNRRVLVAGTGSDDLSEPERWMSEALGQALAVAGFSLVTGGWQGTDEVVATAYAERVTLENIPPDRWLTQVVAGERRPEFQGGKVVVAEREFQFPMNLVEAVVLIGGRRGTRAFFEYAKEGGKRVYPMPGTGGEARRVFEELLAVGGSEAEALRRFDVPLDSPDAAQRVARTLVELLLAGDTVRPKRWATSVIVTPDAVPVLQRDLPSDWDQIVVIPVDRSGTVRLNGEVRSRLGLPPTVSPPTSGFSLVPAVLGSQDITRAFLVTLGEPGAVRMTIATNLRALLSEFSQRTRVRIWLPLLGREGGGLSREEALELILHAIAESGVTDRTEMYFVVATATDTGASELIELRTMVEKAAARPLHDVRGALSEAGITGPDDATVMLFYRAAQLMFMQRSNRNNGRIKTHLALLALLESGRQEQPPSPAGALSLAWDALDAESIDRVLARELPLLHNTEPQEPGPIIFSRDCAEVLHLAVERADGAAVELFHIVDALLEQASHDVDRNKTTARRLLDNLSVDPIRLRDTFNGRRPFHMEPQQQANWSWCATALSIAKYFDPTIKLSQCELANEVLDRTDCCTSDGDNLCDIPWSLDRALLTTGNLESVSLGSLTASEVVERLDNGEIIPIRIEWVGGGGHFQVIGGYYRAAGGDLFADVHDSFRGESRVRFEAMASEQEFQWTHTYRVRAVAPSESDRRAAREEEIGARSRLAQLEQQICHISTRKRPVGLGILILPDQVLTAAEVVRDIGATSVSCMFPPPPHQQDHGDGAAPTRVGDPSLAYFGEPAHPVDDAASFAVISLFRPRSESIQVLDGNYSATTPSPLAVGTELRVLSIDSTGHNTDFIAVVSSPAANQTRFYYKAQKPASTEPPIGSPIFDQNLQLVGLHGGSTASQEYEGLAVESLGADFSHISR